ncbi:hypothetical protein Kpol_1002p116, partial [Vanderwaltozyma polyspora DSM 70294]
ITLVNKSTPSTFEKISCLVVKTDNSESKFSIASFVDILSKSKDLSSDFISNGPLFIPSVPNEKKLYTTFDLLSTNFLRLLVLLEFFEFNLEAKKLIPTKWGSALLKLNTLDLDPKFYEKHFILLMFLKFDVLKLSQELQPSTISALSQATLNSYPKEYKFINVLSRLLTLYQIEQAPYNYHGPIEKQALIIREHFNFVKENLKELYEATIVSSLTSGEFDRLTLDDAQWKELVVSKMPFKAGLPNTIMAMMWEFYLQKYLHNGKEKADAFSFIAAEFNTTKSVPNLEEQFNNSYKFLNDVSKIVSELATMQLIPENDATLVNEAVEFCAKSIS